MVSFLLSQFKCLCQNKFLRYFDALLSWNKANFNVWGHFWPHQPRKKGKVAIDPKTDTVQYPKQNFNALLYSSLTYRAIRLCFEMSMNSSGALSQKGISKAERFYFGYCTVSCSSFTEFCLKAEILLFFSTKLSIESVWQVDISVRCVKNSSLSIREWLQEILALKFKDVKVDQLKPKDQKLVTHYTL